MKVYVMTSEHYRDDGIVRRVTATRDLAVREAIACANIMLKDAGKPAVATEDEMDAAMDALQEEYGAVHCYAYIDEHDLIVA